MATKIKKYLPPIIMLILGWGFIWFLWTTTPSGNYAGTLKAGLVFGAIGILVSAVMAAASTTRPAGTKVGETNIQDPETNWDG